MQNKLNKPLILVAFSVVSWLSAVARTKALLNSNQELNDAFSSGTTAATYAKLGYIIFIFIGSFISVFIIQLLWNNLIPRITGWRIVDYWETMGITALILLITLL